MRGRTVNIDIDRRRILACWFTQTHTCSREIKSIFFPYFSLPTCYHRCDYVYIYIRRNGDVDATVLFSAFVIGFCYTTKHYSGPVWGEGVRSKGSLLLLNSCLVILSQCYSEGFAAGVDWNRFIGHHNTCGVVVLCNLLVLCIQCVMDAKLY